MSDLKQLMGDAISDDVAEKLQNILDESVSSVQSELEELRLENALLKESHETEVDFLKQKAEEYAEKVRQETINEMTEKAEAYGEYLIAQGQAYGDYITEQAEQYGQYIIGKADEYGEYLMDKADEYAELMTITESAKNSDLQEKAEAYGLFLQEKAEAYGEYVRQECLAESRQAIEEFKRQHIQEFEKLDEMNRMQGVFSSLKNLVESFDFEIDGEKQTQAMSKRLDSERSKNRELIRENREMLNELKGYKIMAMLAENDELTYRDKERIVENAKLAKCDNDELLGKVVNSLVESALSKKSTLNENRTHSKTKTMLDENVGSNGSQGGTGTRWNGTIV